MFKYSTQTPKCKFCKLSFQGGGGDNIYIGVYRIYFLKLTFFNININILRLSGNHPGFTIYKIYIFPALHQKFSKTHRKVEKRKEIWLSLKTAVTLLSQNLKGSFRLAPCLLYGSSMVPPWLLRSCSVPKGETKPKTKTYNYG